MTVTSQIYWKCYGTEICDGNRERKKPPYESTVIQGCTKDKKQKEVYRLMNP